KGDGDRRQEQGRKKGQQRWQLQQAVGRRRVMARTAAKKATADEGGEESDGRRG
ncbi:hypothetical protein GW17_00026201, partial [Ensete ventricosum]